MYIIGKKVVFKLGVNTGAQNYLVAGAWAHHGHKVSTSDDITNFRAHD